MKRLMLDAAELTMLVRRDPDSCTWGAALITAAIVAVMIAAALA